MNQNLLQQLDEPVIKLTLAIEKHLMETKISETRLRHFDLYDNQLDEDREGKETFQYPAAFIRFNPIDWETLTENYQQGTAEFFIVIADKKLGKTAHKIADHERLKSLDSFNLKAAVSKAIHGATFPEAEAGTIRRVRTDDVDSLRGIVTHVITFQCRITDSNLTKKYIKPETPPAIDASVELL